MSKYMDKSMIGYGIIVILLIVLLYRNYKYQQFKNDKYQQFIKTLNNTYSQF